MLPKPAHGVGVCRADDLHPGGQGATDVRAGEVEPVGQAVHLQRDAGLERNLEDVVEIERVLRAVVEDPAERMREARGRRCRRCMSHGLDDARRQLGGAVLAGRRGG